MIGAGAGGPISFARQVASSRHTADTPTALAAKDGDCDDSDRLFVGVEPGTAGLVRQPNQPGGNVTGRKISMSTCGKAA